MVRPSTPPKSSFKERKLDFSSQGQAHDIVPLVTLPAGTPKKVDIMLSLLKNNPSGVVANDLKNEVAKFGYSATDISTRGALKNLAVKGMIEIGKTNSGKRDVQLFKITSLGEMKLAGLVPASKPKALTGIEGSGALSLARDSATRPIDLAKLSVHRNKIVRLAVAKNPSTPTSSLRNLSFGRTRDVDDVKVGDKTESISDIATENLVKRLQKPGIDAIIRKGRSEFISEPELPVKTIEKLFRTSGGNPNILIPLAKNPNTPLNILEEMFDRLPSYGLQSWSYIGIARDIANNPNTNRSLKEGILKKFSDELILSQDGNVYYQSTKSIR
jgi:hypothetical protein